MSSVQKRILPSGRVHWRCDYRDQAGTRRAKSFRTKKEAVDYEITVGSEIRAGTHVADSASVTVEKAGELWLQRCHIEGLETSTVRQYDQHLRHHIMPHLGTMKLSKLSRPGIEEFRDTLLQSRSRALTRKVLTSLKSLLSEAQRRGLVVQNAASGTRIIIAKRHEEKAQIPSKDEIRALLTKTAELWPCTLPWRPLVLAGVFTGMRASELRGLIWDNVDFEDKVIHVRQRADFKNKIGSPKSAAGTRDIPLPPMVLNALRQWRLACPKSALNLVFPTRTGGIISNSNIHRQCWRPLLRAVDLASIDGTGNEVPRYRFHDLRHAAASLMIDQGWQAKKIMSVMGHSSIQITFNTYGHLWQSAEADAGAMAQIEARLFA